jgi:hypothetical protein
VFYDSTGAVIDYGNRWGFESPPSNSYSVTSNTQRFAPLHTVADALIEHLKSTYAVSVSEDLSLAGKLAAESSRAIRLVPLNQDCAALTFLYTTFPGIVVHAGLLHEFVFPPCGCDACDESIEEQVEDLEQLVLAVASGDYCETLSMGPEVRVAYRIAFTYRLRSGWRRESHASSLSEAETRLRKLPQGRWQPWRVREESFNP